jgi:hypothetical protein
MKHLVAAAAGALAVITFYTLNPPAPTVVWMTEEIETVVDRDVLRMVELEDLRGAIDDLDAQLHEGCLDIIAHITGDPRQGIANLIDRHYQGDACTAAEEALAGGW